MATRSINNLKLGLFVLAGLAFLIQLMYMIGKNKNFFGRNYELRARFSNVQGLVAGNNVRFSGIQAGTVKKISILNDTTIEVLMTIEDRMKTVIRKNAQASIGTEGLVGNKVLNIIPGKNTADFAADGDLIFTRKTIDTDEMLQTLSKTNNDVAIIAEGLKTTIERINSSSALWSLLNDQSIPGNIKQSVSNIRQATEKANLMATDLHNLVKDIKEGKGSAGALLTDTTFAYNLNTAVLSINQVGKTTDSLAREIKNLAAGIKEDVNNGKGTVHALLKDSIVTENLNASLENIRKGTDGFNQAMDAIKHSFLLRGYFKKLEKKKQQELKKKLSTENK